MTGYARLKQEYADGGRGETHHMRAHHVNECTLVTQKTIHNGCITTPSTYIVLVASRLWNYYCNYQNHSNMTLYFSS